ncbi:hypothetical protein GJ496_001242 [Pomphorhynchus laevis]|nr:hypothetical protein GJ496_001242 [Pomphorhynchus laevis]
MVNFRWSILDRQFQIVNFRSSISDRQFQIVNFRSSIPDRQFQIVNFRSSISDGQFQMVNFRWSISDGQFQMVNFISSIPDRQFQIVRTKKINSLNMHLPSLQLELYNQLKVRVRFSCRASRALIPACVVQQEPCNQLKIVIIQKRVSTISCVSQP